MGVQIGLEDHLEAIKRNNSHETDDCYRELLTIWIKKGGATWEALVIKFYCLET